MKHISRQPVVVKGSRVWTNSEKVEELLNEKQAGKKEIETAMVGEINKREGRSEEVKDPGIGMLLVGDEERWHHIFYVDKKEATGTGKKIRC